MPRRNDFSFEIGDELIEVDVVANMEADVHHSRERRAHMLHGLRESFGTTHRLVGIAILQEFDHDVVELDEPHVEALGAIPQIGYADRPRIDAKLIRQDLLIGKQRVLDRVALEIAMAEHFRPAKDFRVELISAFHVLNGESEVLHPLQPCSEGAVVQS